MILDSSQFRETVSCASTKKLIDDHDPLIEAITLVLVLNPVFDLIYKTISLLVSCWGLRLPAAM